LPDRKRLEMARALATDPKLLLLDEVMAGLRPVEIDRMVEILRHDAPWVYMLHPKDYTLAHAWVFNRKPNKMANNGLKYQRIEPQLRRQKRAEWNQPVVWPIAAALVALALALTPAVRSYRKRERASGKLETA
jgi:ABC-type iron transport system FetAB ATPase subunit